MGLIRDLHQQGKAVFLDKALLAEHEIPFDILNVETIVGQFGEQWIVTLESEYCDPNGFPYKGKISFAYGNDSRDKILATIAEYLVETKNPYKDAKVVIFPTKNGRPFCTLDDAE